MLGITAPNDFMDVIMSCRYEGFDALLPSLPGSGILRTLTGGVATLDAPATSFDAFGISEAPPSIERGFN